jgi:uncharacterized membrane protein YedE/YeeE
VTEETGAWLAGGGLLLGLIFGVLAQRSSFCLVAAVSNLLIFRDHRQLHAWLATFAVALGGTAILELTGPVDIGASAYRRPDIDWIGALFGGLIFGYGAMLAGGRASRTLVRSTEGNLGALLSLITFGLAGMVALFGALEPFRALIAAHAVWLPAGGAAAASALGLPLWTIPTAGVLLCLGGLLGLGDWRAHRGLVSVGASIGGFVVIGWWVTGVLGAEEWSETRPASLTVAGPLARALAWLTIGQVSGTAFVLSLTPGVLIGALASAIATGTFRWIPPAADRVASYLGGGLLMGVGAMLAGGCNIGQGLTGTATGSLTSLLALSGILSGMLLAVRRLGRTSG